MIDDLSALKDGQCRVISLLKDSPFYAFQNVIRSWILSLLRFARNDTGAFHCLPHDTSLIFLKKYLTY